MKEPVPEFDETTFKVSCDYCDYSEKYKASSWNELMRAMKDDGWISKNNLEYICKGCHKKRLVANLRRLC
jgi:hypothetical protein